jgi:uncharacterized membrane protein YphA (DoxX/SURF4 family)
MPGFSSLEQRYHEAKANKWFRYFAIFCRIALALGFIPSGFVKIMGERFTGLTSNHPLGQYFDALYLTGYYYTFIGVVQLTAAALLLIPRTALLGAIIYFPVILNICVLAYSVRFEGTRITTMMLLANLFLLCWHYDRLKYVLPFYQPKSIEAPKSEMRFHKFPFAFFGSVIAIVALVILINAYMYDIRPGNSLEECNNGCPNTDKPCKEFCDCIHNQGQPLEQCLDAYAQANERSGK